MRPGVGELVQHRIEQVRVGVAHPDIAAAHGGRAQERAGLDAIRQHPVAGAAQRAHAVDDDAVGAGAGDLRAHAVEEVGEIDHLGLARGVLEHRRALGQRRGHHQVLGAGHGDQVHHQLGTLEAFGTRLDVAVFDRDVGAHLLQAVDVQVDRARADGTAAGQRHLGLAEAGQQRPQHQDGGAHGLDQLVGGAQGADIGSIHLHAHALANDYPRPQLPEELDDGGYIPEVGDIGEIHGGIGQQGGGQQRQGGVLRPAHPHIALQAVAPLQDDLVHKPARLPAPGKTEPGRTPAAKG